MIEDILRYSYSRIPTHFRSPFFRKHPMIAIRLHPSTGLTSYHPARAYGENTFKVGSISSNHWDKGHQQPKTLLFNMFGTWFTHIFQISLLLWPKRCNGMVFEVQHTSLRCIPWILRACDTGGRWKARRCHGRCTWQFVFGAELVHLETWGWSINSIEFHYQKDSEIG